MRRVTTIPTPAAMAAALALVGGVGPTTAVARPDRFLREHYGVFRVARTARDRLPAWALRGARPPLRREQSRFLARIGGVSSYLVPMRPDRLCLVMLEHRRAAPTCDRERFFAAGQGGYTAVARLAHRTLFEAVLPDGAHDVTLRRFSRADGSEVGPTRVLHPYRNLAARLLPGAASIQWSFRWASRRGAIHRLGF